MSNDEIWREFLLETHENLALLDADLIRLEKHPSEKSTLAQVFRTLHSVKGTAGFMGLVKLQAIAHSAESLLSRLRAGELVFNAPIATALLQVVDAIRVILSQIEAHGGEGSGDYTALAAQLDRLREGKTGSEASVSAPTERAQPATATESEPPQPAALFRAAATVQPNLPAEQARTRPVEPQAVDRLPASAAPPLSPVADRPTTPAAPSDSARRGQAGLDSSAGPAQQAPPAPPVTGWQAAASWPRQRSAEPGSEAKRVDESMGEAVPRPTPDWHSAADTASYDSASYAVTAELPAWSVMAESAGVGDASRAVPKEKVTEVSAGSASVDEERLVQSDRGVAVSGRPARAASLSGSTSSRQPAKGVSPQATEVEPTQAPDLAQQTLGRDASRSAGSREFRSESMPFSPSTSPSSLPSTLSLSPSLLATGSKPLAATASATASSLASVSATSLSNTVDFSEPRVGGVADSTIRVDVGLLDRLMTLVGELVLARNQILQYSAGHDDGGFLGAVQRLNLLTSDLQANVMKTRMQPIGTVLGKFPRIVRDLAIACGKHVNFELDGQETELDKTLLEAIRDPLTHLVRNAVDHGIELPAVREAAGKSPAGRLRMVAFHEGGKVMIEITDDGAGIQVDRVREKALANKIITAEAAARMSRQELLQLIFLPGFSTAEKVTQFSGRGVGMDVVRTNMERIGGTVEIESTPGQGTTIRSKIPLTLAIIPALIISSGEERYAIPQVSLLELVHLDAEQVRRSVERMHEVPVYRLRGELLPLVFLHEQFGLESNRHDMQELSIVVVQADDRPFGLVVDAIRDTEEIVVKPLQKQLKGISLFAGAAIMGDGRVALVLDVLGLARHARVVSGARSRVLGEIQRPAAPKVEEAPPALLVQTRTGEQMAVPLDQVARLEEFSAAQLEQLGERTVVQYRGTILPLIDLSVTLQDLQAYGDRKPPTGSRVASAAGPIGSAAGSSAAALDVAAPSPHARTVPVVVYGEGSHQVGLIVDRILDIAPVPVSQVRQWSRPGTLFTTIVQDRVTEVIDVPRLVGLAWQVCGQEVR